MTSLQAADTSLIPERPRVKALFISKVRLDFSETHIRDHVIKILGDDAGSVAVTILESRHSNYYGSFHVQVPQEDFRYLLDKLMWPLGVQFRPYRGELKEYRIFGKAAEGQTENGKARKRPRAGGDDEEDAKAMEN